MDIDKIEVGKKIKNIRLDKSKNLREFGELISENLDEKKTISDSIVSRWEKGISIPSAKRLKEIANIGGVSTNYLLYGDEFSYLDIEKKINTEKMAKIIKENLAHFLRHYLYYSTYNSNNEKTGELLNLFLNKEDISFDNMLDKMYSLISNENYTFYINGAYLLLNEKFEKLHVQIYLTEFIYQLLIQLALDYPKIYFENLLLQIDDTKTNIKEISMKRDVYKDEEISEKLANFINREEYREIFDDLDKLKLKIKDGNIILNED